MTELFFVLLLSYTENAEEQQVLAELYLKYRKSVEKYISKHLTADCSDIEDCVQQAYLGVARNIATVAKLEPRRQLAYLLTAAHTTIQQFLLKRKAVVFVDIENEKLDNYLYALRHRAAPSAEAVTMDRETLLAFANRLSELTPTEQVVFRLYFLGKMDREELAKKLGVSMNTVRSYISRTNRHAQQILREVCNLD